jgi:hypothetical protein
VVHFSVSFHGAGALNGVARRRHRELRPRAEAVAGTGTGEFFKHRSAGGSTARFFTLDCHARLWTVTRANHAGFWQEALANLQNTIDEKVEESGLPDNLAALRDRALNTVDAARVTCRREIEAFQREQEEHFSRLDAEAAAAAADAADAAAAARACAAARAALDAMDALAAEPPSPLLDEPAPPPPPEPLHSPPTERLLARLAALNPLADAQALPRASSEGSDLVVVAHSDAGSSVVLVDAADAEDPPRP